MNTIEQRRTASFRFFPWIYFGAKILQFRIKGHARPLFPSLMAKSSKWKLNKILQLFAKVG